MRDFIVPKIMKHSEVELYINGYRIVVPTDGAVGECWDKHEMESLGRNRETVEVTA